MVDRTTIIPIALLLTLVATPAYAYGGPGIAIALLGSIFGLAGAIAGAVFFVLLWPCVYLYRYVKSRKAKRHGGSTVDSNR